MPTIPFFQFNLVQSLSHVWLFVTPWTAAGQASCPSPTLGAYSNSCPLSWWCHPTISSSIAPFSSCPQSFPGSKSFPVSWLFTSGGQSIGASASALALPMNNHGWFPLGLTGLISLLSKDFDLTPVLIMQTLLVPSWPDSKLLLSILRIGAWDFPSGLVVKSLPCSGLRFQRNPRIIWANCLK